MKPLILLIAMLLTLSGCGMDVGDILANATHGCGKLHVEGASDSQGDIVIAKAPPEWTPEEIKAFCDT